MRLERMKTQQQEELQNDADDAYESYDKFLLLFILTLRPGSIRRLNRLARSRTPGFYPHTSYRCIPSSEISRERRPSGGTCARRDRARCVYQFLRFHLYF